MKLAASLTATLLLVSLAACRDERTEPKEATVAREDAGRKPDDGAAPRVMVVPPDAAAPPWLEQRASDQRAAATEWAVRHDFRFVDRRPESGIRFVHGITPDSGKDYRPVHYDHGNGIVVADVDGDGRLDLYFVNQRGGNELWRNLGNGRFEDITARAGVAIADRIGVGAAFADVDNDGDADLFVTNVRSGNVLFENLGGARFRDISEAAGLDYAGHSSGAVFFDYDRDGRLDLFVANVGRYTSDERIGNYYTGLKDAFSGHLKPERAERSLLYRNLGGNRFAEVSEELGLIDERWSGAATPIDADGDGWSDLYVLSMQGLDGFYRNDGGTRFESRGPEVFPRSSWGAMGVKAFDFDNDGDLDLFTTDMHSDMDEIVPVEREKSKASAPFSPSFLRDDGRGIYGNSFFRNEGDGSFVEVSDEVGAENFWPWGLSVGDLNADGRLDVFVTASMNFPFRYGVNSLLLNTGGRFVDAEFVLGVEPQRDARTSVPWFEMDCSGADREHRRCEGRTRATGPTEVHAALGSRSSVIFDIEGDGDLDIVTNDFGSEPMLLISDLSDRHAIRYLGIALEGVTSNRSGLGARVTLRAGEASYTQVHDGQSGYLSQSLLPLYFGLGESPQVDEIVVSWPSGSVQRIPGPIETNRVLEIIEEPAPLR
jgi:hypothetical protein